MSVMDISIYQAINHLKANLDKRMIELNPPASDELIAEVESFFNITLPDDIKQFYKFANGFESDEDMFGIVPLNDMIENKKRWIDSDLYIAEWLIYGTTWSLETNQNDYHINSLDDGNEPHFILTKSFPEFLNRFINGGLFEKGGMYDWNNEVRLASGLPTNLP